jgi:ectoine hydroxylase-related dioxygenase (phytanoyl-CoA dioxygenase family)
MPFDATHIDATFQQYGYVVLEKVLSQATINRVSSYVYAQVAGYEAVFERKMGFAWRNIPAIEHFLDSQPDFDQLDGEIKHLIRGELPLAIRLSSIVKLIAHDPELQRVLRQLLTTTALRMHNPPSLRVVFPGARQAGVPLHQDTYYNSHMTEFVTAWVPLCDIDEECAGVEVLEGSHVVRRSSYDRGLIWFQLHQEQEIRNRFRSRSIYCTLGDVLLFSPYLFHASRPNRSARVRCSIDYRFFPATTHSDKPYYDIDQRVVMSPNGSIMPPIEG